MSVDPEVTADEKVGSRIVTGGDSPAIRRTWNLYGSSDQGDIFAKLLSEAGASFDGIPLKDLQAEPVFVDVDDDAACLWEGTATYSYYYRQQTPETGDEVYQFDIEATTQHVEVARSQTKYSPSGGPAAPDCYGLIGAVRRDDGGYDIQGTDIIIPQFTWPETHYLDAAAVTAAYKDILFDLMYKVNDDTFRGRAAGEVKIMGCRGAKRGQGDWELSFRFQARPNERGLTIGGVTDIDKGGWEHLHVMRKESAPSESQLYFNIQVIGVYVSELYLPGDYGQLGIGEGDWPPA
jgi:hypothetical protein